MKRRPAILGAFAAALVLLIMPLCAVADCCVCAGNQGGGGHCSGQVCFSDDCSRCAEWGCGGSLYPFPCDVQGTTCQLVDPIATWTPASTVPPTPTKTVTPTITPTASWTPSITRTPDAELAPYCVYSGLLGRGSTGIEVIGPSTAAFVPLPGIDRIRFIAKTPDGAMLYVGERFLNGMNDIAVIDTATNALIGRIPVDALAVAFSRDGRWAYVVTAADLLVINTRTLAVDGGPVAINPSSDPRWIAISTSGRHAYITHQGVSTPRGFLEVVDLQERRLTDSVPVPPLVPEGRSIVTHVAIDPDGTIYVGIAQFVEPLFGTQAAVGVIPAGQDSIASVIPVCVNDIELFQVLKSPIENELHVLCGKNVDVVNLATGRVVISVPLAMNIRSLTSLAGTTDGQLVFSLRERDSSSPSAVVIFDPRERRVRGEIPAPADREFEGMAVTDFPCFSAPIRTPTATGEPTPTATPGKCSGDCDGDGAVAVNELILAVNMALGQRPVGECPSADANGDQAISINELVAAVGSALNECAG